MRSNDNFWRESIEGNPPHQAWLNPDHYEEEGSPLRTFLTIGAAVGAVVGGRHAFRQGAMRDIARSFIRAMAGFRPTEADTIMTSLKQWADTPKPWDQYTNIRDKLFAPKGVFGGGLEEAMAQLDKRLQTNRQHLVSRGVAGGKALLSDELDIEAVLREAELATEINARGLSNKNKQRVFQLTRDYLKEYNVYTKEMIAEDINRYGMRRATIADVYNAQGGKGVLFDRSSDTTMHRRALIEKWRVELGNDTLMNKMADPWVFVDETGKLYDLRYWPKVGKSVLNSLETDFGLPFLRFNPLAMFHIGDILNVRSTPKIHLMAPTEIQPSVSGRQTTDKLYLMLGDMLHDVEDAAARPIRGYLIDTKGPGANFLQGITGAGAPRPEDYQYPTTGWRKHWASVTRVLDIGHMRKEHYGTHGFDITNFMTDFIAWPADKFWKHMKPYTNQNLWSKRPFGSSFGRPGQADTETPYLFMRKTRYDNPVDFVKQVFAHRDRTEDITTASVPFYYFFSRLDAALAQFGLGLSAEHRRSGADIFLNMVLRRALPVWGAVEAWKYFNYEAENLTGVRPEELLAEGYKETSIAAAHVRDVLGITDWAKRFKFLLPGGEQISELPLIGRFTDLDKSAEETEEYWESGEDPVRKGRWWFFGNCIHPNTPIQLADGTLLSAKDMQVGYSVLTHTGESHRVLQVIVRKMKISEWAPKIKVHGFPEATITTDNHPYLVVKKKHCPSSEYDNCRPDRPCNLNRPYKQCAKRYEWRADWILARYVEPGDFLAYPRFKMTGSITVIDGIPLNIETGYLVGIILAEGHINKWYHGRGYQIETTHNVTERDIVEKLDNIVNRYFGVSGTVRIAGKGGTLKYRICSKKVAGWIQDFLYRGREKLFPGGIQNYPEDFAIGIVKGMFEGDGHISKNGKDSFQLCLTAKRMNHIIGIRNILFALGISNTVGEHEVYIQSKHYIAYRIFVTGDAAKILYKLIDYREPCPTSLNLTGKVDKYIYIDSGYVYIRVESVEDSGYHGVVYDYEIEEAHSFCGLTVVLHNTPFTGSRVMYYTPNWVRRTQSQYKYTDTLYGSEEEYFAHAPYPTPRFPLAPLRHFITDPYHWERCVTEGTPIIRNDGSVVPIEEIKVEDRVITFTGETKPIQDKWVNEINEEVIRITPALWKAFPIMSTVEHRYFAIRTEKCQQKCAKAGTFCVPNKTWARCKTCKYKFFISYAPQWLRADELKTGDYLVVPRPRLTETLTELRLPQPVEYWNGHAMTIGRQKQLRNVIPVSKELFRFFGYYLSEGHVDKRHIVFSFAGDEMDLCLDVANISKRLFNLDATIEQPDINKLSVRVHHSGLTKWISELLGKGAENKKVNPILLEAPKSCLEAMIGAWYLGDGTYKGHDISVSASTISETLAHQMKFILMALGYIPSLQVISPGGKRRPSTTYMVELHGESGNRLRRLVNWPVIKEPAPSKWYWTDEQFIYVKIINTETVQYQGRIYDLKIEDNFSFMSVGAVLHNTHYEDRPYLLTGGLAELEEFPLIGPLLNFTIGQILKPQRRMHPEIWEEIEGKDTKVYIAGSVNDPMYESQWHMQTMQMEKAWENVAGSRPQDVIVAVLDTGVDMDHPDLKPNLLSGYNVYTNDSNVQDVQGHGTHVAGIIAAVGNNAQGVVGGAYPVVKILPVKVLNDQGLGGVEDIERGIKWATNWRGPNGERVDIINMSLGSDNIHFHFDEEIRAANEAGILVVAAAGNSNLNYVGSPAITPETLAVGAVDEQLRRASYSNYGYGLDIMGPGSNILSTYPDDDYNILSGTSMATPFVSSVAALLKAQQPDLTPAEMRYIMQGTVYDAGEPGWDPEYGSGIINPVAVTTVGKEVDTPEERAQIRRGGRAMEEQIAAERRELMEQMREKARAAAVSALAIYDEYNREIKNPVTAEVTALQIWENIKEFGGFYGFSTELAYDTTGLTEPQIATARAMYSYRRGFWDVELGGLPGDINEIARRFIGKREKWENRYNPIPNRMPDWLPGEDYFTDFRRGDPYVKIRRGEMRLPGEAYETLYPDTAAAVEAALADPRIRQALEQGLITREDLYDPISRLRILADVAPWSEEYREQSKYVTAMRKTKEQQEEVREIRQQVRERNKPIRMYDYRFTYGKTKKETVTVTKVVDDWDDSHEYFIYTKEYPDHPIKLAGMHVPMGKDRPEARRYLNERIKPGQRITIEYTADELHKFNDDTYETISAVVYSGRENLNLTLIREGLVDEKVKDFSPAGVAARFSEAERMVGRAWEKFAHMDTPFHTKLLQVRSPVEQYHRRDLYGKDWQEWQDPWSDFIVPTFQSIMAKGPLVGTLFGASLGRMAGVTPFGRLMGTIIGGLTGGIGGAYFSGYELFTGQTWVPERRRREWEVNEYYDMLRYIKNLSLYNKYAQLSLEREEFDVKEYLKEKEEQKQATRERIYELEDAKRAIKATVGKVDVDYWKEKLGLEGEAKDARELVKLINKELTRLKAPKEEEKLPPLATKALEYYKESRRTMYGHRSGDPYAELLSAIPKKERKYLQGFIEAPPEEREKVKDTLSPYMRRIVERAWGEKPEPKPGLVEYFRTHFLPDPEWGGWREDVNLDDVKVKYIKIEGLDPSEFDVWPDDEAAARQPDVPPAPKINVREKAEIVGRKLRAILGGAGIEAEILVEPNNTGQLDIEAEVVKDIRQELADYVNQYGSLVLS